MAGNVIGQAHVVLAALEVLRQQEIDIRGT
ncbi:hypothetical protein O204_14750 [Pseudomonas simiae]|jgi:hypothetical protein|uniref:Uncharacterized protein n=1 Tax=Pseudomonas simiae TaxID=321846 RepID=U1TXG6_9PSED|nr:hypothetical protein O204_14750 [Pseudomonas simiae]